MSFISPIASAISYVVNAVGGISRSISAKFAESISVKDFGAVGNGVTDDSPAFQAAINYINSIGGGKVLVPEGVFLFGAPVKTFNYVIVKGRGDASQILVNSDIEVFNSDTTTASTAIFRAEFRDLFINKTVSTATTKYDIHLQNPNFCKLIRVHIKSGHADNQYSSTNVGGVFFDKPNASTSTAFCNLLNDCWMQNNSAYFLNITDSDIKGGYYWGHVRQFAIRLAGSTTGNISVKGVSGIITSQYNGGIWLDGSGINQIRIIGNEWDGNPLLIRGDGIYAPQSTTQVTVAGNTFWGCGKNGLNISDPVGWTVSGNNFWKNNDSDNGYDDVRISGVTFQPNNNTFSGNTHTMDVARVNKGYAYREVNAGFTPVNNSYKNNTMTSATNYLGGLLALAQADYDGSMGGSSTALYNQHQFGPDGFMHFGAIQTAVSGDVAAGGTLDMPINTDAYFGNPGGFSGILTVTATRENFPTQSRRTVYMAVGYGTTAVFTSLGTQDGSGGGSAFTITMSANGTVRFTDTSASGSVIGVRMAFHGSKSLA